MVTENFLIGLLIGAILGFLICHFGGM